MTPTKKTDPSEPINWASVLESLKSESSGDLFFVKAQKTRIRIVNLEDDPRNFFCPAMTTYRGKPKQKMIFFGIILGTDKGELSEKWVNKIVPIVVPKTALQGILGILADGYDLFSETEGHGITIVRSRTETDTTYNVLPSPKPVPIDLSQFEPPELTLMEYAEQLTQRGKNHGNNDGEDW